jgi:hypothetical protein
MMPVVDNFNQEYPHIIEVHRDEQEAEKCRKELEKQDGIKYYIEEWKVW